MIVCMDTAVLIWGVQGVASPGTEAMPSKTRAFLESLAGQCDILIPTPVLTEFLQKFPKPEQQQYLRDISKIDGIFFHPFDLEASLVAAELQAGRRLRELRRELHADRVCVKTDLMILAIAVVVAADKLITPDVDDYHKLASSSDYRFPEISNVPDAVSQPNFFDTD